MRHIKRITVVKASYGSTSTDTTGILAMVFNFVLDLARVKNKAHTGSF